MNKRYANARHEAARGRLDSAGQSSIGSVQSSTSKAADATPYVLGNSQAELGRLTFQATILRPIMERLFREAGITQGMRVLDLGCGPGDVPFLAIEIVGLSGCVIGIDRDPVAIALARYRARQQGSRNVACEQTGIEEFSSAVQFDAVVGRCILVFQPDPPAFLRHVMRFIGPNGVLALHEISLRHRFRSNPTVSLWDGAGDWLVAGFNPERDVANRLVEHFMAADLRFPTMFAELPIGGGASSPLYAGTAETIQSLLPAIAASGIATAGEISVETLGERLRDAVVAANAQVEFIPQICGWAMLSRTHNGGAAGPAST